MRLTIVPDDGIVTVNETSHKVDCSSVEPDIHAVQWYDDHGEIEFKNIDGVRAPNQKITNMTDFGTVIQLWNIENAKPPPEPLPIPPEIIAFKERFAVFAADADRQDLVDQLKAATPEQIKNYINGNVTDLASAKVLLVKFALILALLVNR